MVISRSRPLLLAVLVASTASALVVGVSAAAAATRYQYLQSRYQAICEERGSFFLDGEAGWGCRSSVGGLTQDSYDALSRPCQEAGGTPSGTASHGEYFVIYCDGIDRASPTAPEPGGGLPGAVRVQVTVALTEARVLVLEVDLSSWGSRAVAALGVPARM